MLSRIPVHRFAALSLVTCRASVGRPPTISRFAPTCSHRHQRLLSDSPAATAAAKDRRWVILSSYGHCRSDDSSFVADANTVAESCTSKGRRVRVSFRCAAPPWSSYLYYNFPDSARVGESDDSISVVAAHGELVLLEMMYHPRSGFGRDYFMYRPAGAGQPPLLSLLPVPDFLSKSDSVFESPPIHPVLDTGSICLLRRGENDLLVVQVELWYNRDEGRDTAVFCVLRPGMRQWELMEPVPILQDEGGKDHGMGSPKNAICVGDRFLCWVSYGCDFLLCDMADEASPKVRSVRLPPESVYDDDENSPERVRRMGAAGDSSVRLVSISNPVCHCDYGERKTCWHPRFVITIKTWTMNLSMDEPLEWVEDGEINGEEIWAIPGYEGLPHAILEWPVVCFDKPNVVCFLVSDYHFTRDDEKVWMVQLNISTKTLLSVVQFPNNDHWMEYYHLPAELQY